MWCLCVCGYRVRERERDRERVRAQLSCVVDVLNRLAAGGTRCYLMLAGDSESKTTKIRPAIITRVN